MRALFLISISISMGVAFGVLSPTLQAAGDAPAAWSYHGAKGPGAWGHLDKHYSACRTGKRQSPIDIRGARGTSQATLGFDYLAGATRMANNGHSVEITFAKGDRVGNGLTLDGRPYPLRGVHFHAPSEHRINGKRYALEAHFVHGTSNDDLVVVGVLFEQGDFDDPVLDDLGTRWPGHTDYEYYLPERPRALDLLPASRDYFRYDGSLTRPPCSETVTWVVLKQPRNVSHPQLHRIREAMGGPNARPVQSRNGRAIWK
ncbi:MAG: carbonic anhydrase family protein [Chromatiales bacterium]|jgi:carbonic anhydrase|nr:carbonic anhydrase family protein [Chromatiales bacterium]